MTLATSVRLQVLFLVFAFLPISSILLAYHYRPWHIAELFPATDPINYFFSPYRSLLVRMDGQ